MIEIFKQIDKAPYFITNLGRVFSMSRVDYRGRLIKGKELKPMKTDRGYLTVVIYYNNKPKRVKIHRLVASAFLSNKENKKTVNHKDGNKENNNVFNLEWNTQKENVTHAFNIGLNSFNNNRKRNSNGQFI